jgi:AraC-like DNA-binding protein
MNEPPIHFWRPAPIGGAGFLAATLTTDTLHPHVHEEWQFAVVEQRGGVLSLGGFRGSLVQPADVTVVAPLEVHSESTLAGPHVTWRALYVADDIVRGLCPSVGKDRRDTRRAFQSRTIADANSASELRALLRRSELGGGNTQFLPHVRAWLRRVFADHPHQVSGRAPSGRVARARDFLRARPAETVSLQDAAAAAGITTWHLVRTFSRQVGLPPMGYHLQVRLARARRLLAEGAVATRVAHECGFADQSHLCRRFKELHHLTPGAFRAQAMGRVLADAAQVGPTSTAA